VSFTLTGAVSGFQTFVVIGNTNTTYYSATDSSGNWEVGEGTYSTTGPTLTRTTVYASSNSGSAVTFPGSVNVFVTYPSGKSVNLDGSGNVSALGTVTSGTWQGSTVGVAYGGTGQTTYTNGQLLIGNTTGNTLAKATLTAGTGISITNGAGSITIASTASVCCATPLVAGKVFGRTTNLCCGGLTALGENTAVTGCYSVSVGYAATTSAGGGVAVGGGAFVTGANGVALGLATTAGACAIAIGFSTTATGPCQTHIGPIRFSCCTSGLDSMFYCGTSRELIRGTGGGGVCCATPLTAGIVYGRTEGCIFFCGNGRTALGSLAGNVNQGVNAVAIGYLAGQVNQGACAIAIGLSAGCSGQPASSIAIGTFTTPTGACQTHIGPVRSTCSTTGLDGLFYCACTREVIRGTAGGGGVCCATPTVAGKVFGRTDLCFSGQTGLGYGVNLCGTTGSTAVGYAAAAFGNDATAVGYFSFACANSVVVGSCASAGGSNAVSIGRQALARGCLSVVIGKNAVEDLFTSQNTIVGGNAKAWFCVQCAVIVGRGAFVNCSAKKATVIGAGAFSTAFCGNPCSRSVSIGAGAISAAFATGVGGSSSADCYAAAHGHSASAAYASVAVGSSANVGCSPNSVAVGASSVIFSPCCVASGSVAVGYGATVQGGYSNAIGNAATVTVNCANAIGAFTSNSVAGSTVIKPMRNVTTAHPVYYNPTTGELSYG
jgi:hypothetical protein